MNPNKKKTNLGRLKMHNKPVKLKSQLWSNGKVHSSFKADLLMIRYHIPLLFSSHPLSPWVVALFPRVVHPSSRKQVRCELCGGSEVGFIPQWLFFREIKINSVLLIKVSVKDNPKLCSIAAKEYTNSLQKLLGSGQTMQKDASLQISQLPTLCANASNKNILCFT